VIALLGGFLGSVGAKLAYAYIVATANHTRLLALLFSLVAAVIAGLGMWSLFAGTASRGWLKAFRIAASVISTLAGLSAAFAFYMAVSFISNQGGFLADFKVPTVTVFACLGIAAAVGLVSAALPALRASRISIAEALRYLG
jgi:hypothetical protein